MLERDIKRQILEWLAFQKDCFFWVNVASGVRGRKLQGIGHIRGVSDILGVWRGKPLAIEVKTPDGRLSTEQKMFLLKIHEQGGIAFVATSLEDVIQKLGR